MCVVWKLLVGMIEFKWNWGHTFGIMWVIVWLCIKYWHLGCNRYHITSFIV